MLSLLLFLAAALTIPAGTVQTAFHGHPGAFVLIDCANGQTFRSDPAACARPVPPCSTFKIWNAAIGLQLGEIAGPDRLFWKWDGQARFMKEWNRDQTLHSAFAASCVPAFQALARKTGPAHMQEWLDKINYGNRDIRAGIDVFWLPAPGRQPILISPDQQAALIEKLVNGQLPFSEKPRAVLADIMQSDQTPLGTLYGKTGTGTDPADGQSWAWWVGYVTTASAKTYAYACLLKGQGLTGKDARASTEEILKARGFL